MDASWAIVSTSLSRSAPFSILQTRLCARPTSRPNSSYGHSPNGKVGQWTISRTVEDPPIVVWKVNDTTWIVDDEINDQCARLDGFTESEVTAALVFARAMTWIPARTEHVVKALDTKT